VERLVSIVIATYRRLETLERALRSVANQTYHNIEVVLVDDNADPEWNIKVANIVKEFSVQNPAVLLQLLVNVENLGSAQTRNVGIRAANGEYVTFLDDDDWYLPEKIAHQVTGMGNADYSLTDLQLYSESGKIIDERPRTYIKNNSPKSLLRCHLKYHMTGTDTMMFCREYLLKIGGFPPIDVGDEFYLMKEAICGGGNFAYIQGCHVMAYIHMETDGLSCGDSKINGEKRIFAYKKQFFNQLDRVDRKYICMRHYAVMAFAELRRKRYGAFLLYGVRSFFNSPYECIHILTKGNN